MGNEPNSGMNVIGKTSKMTNDVRMMCVRCDIRN
jgi:hypothetical protein